MQPNKPQGRLGSGVNCIIRDSVTYFSLNIIRVIQPWRVKWALHVARMREVRIVYDISVLEPERKRPFGRRKWKDNI
jgi:hypothetical protein